MTRFFVLIVSVLWASLLLISWSGSTEPTSVDGDGVVQAIR
jgi:hypothetical protein